MAYLPGKMTLRKEFVWNDSFWTPDALSADLALWLDADDASTVTLNGSNVSQWDDKSGNGRNASQAVAADQPTYTSNILNGKPGVAFDGSTDFMTVDHDNALNAQIEPSSVIVLYRERGGFSLMQKGTGPGFTSDAFFMGPDASLAAAGTFTTSYASNENVWNFDIGTFSGATLRHWRNGTKLVPTNVSGGTIVDDELVSDTTPTVNSNQLFIGKRNNPNGTEGNIDGEILETLILTSALSNADRQKLEGYLAHKWGLVANLPSGHPYKIKPPVK